MSKLPDDYILPSGKTVKEVNEYFSLPLEERRKLRKDRKPMERLSLAELKELGIDTGPRLVISSVPKKNPDK